MSAKPRNRAATIAAAALAITGMGSATAKAILPDAKPDKAPLISFRSYQLPVFLDHTTKVLMLEWSRQIGKSHTLANWCVDRGLQQLRNHHSWLIVVLSNSKDNGSEFAMKCGEAARRMGEAVDEVAEELPDAAALEKLVYDDMRFQVTLKIGNRVARILVLAANPRTARGFSGDLVLDEFAFHDDAPKIWEAAEPIISANPEFLCRIASTHNGKASLFNQMARSGNYVVNSVRRSDAWRMGEIKITSLKTNKPITPEEAEAEALDKRAYRQNYENEPGDEMGALIPRELIQVAQRAPFFEVMSGQWDEPTLARLHRSIGNGWELGIGQDVARTTDLSVVDVVGRLGTTRRQLATLEMRGMPLSHQRREMMKLIEAVRHGLRRVCIDSTGLGTGLVDELTDLYGGLIVGCNFSSTVPLTAAVIAEGRKALSMGLPERMALDLLALFEDRNIEIHSRPELLDDLRKPGRVVSTNGRKVSIAAERGKDGHADRFWAMALAEHAFQEDGWGSFDETTAGEVATGGGGMGRAPFITTFSPDSER